MTVELILGDCVEELRKLPEQSVQCCITSPPYYGLRDYGTAKWEGGDQNCDHKNGTLQSDKTTLHPGTNQNDKRNFDGMPYKNVCGKCGAIRIDDQIGLEPTPDEYVAKLVQVFREVKRVLKDDGVLWLNLGDSYASMKSRYNQKAQSLNGGKSQDNEFQGNKTDLYHHKDLGLKDKDLIGIPWAVAFALRADGWYLRSDIIWAKPNPMPESVKDRPTKSHEYVFLLSKNQRYYYDAEAIFEDAVNGDPTSPRGSRGTSPNAGRRKQDLTGNPTYTGFNDRYVPRDYRNKRTVWTINTQPFKGAHFAVMPEKLVEPCVLAGSKVGDIIIDPFNGSGTVGAVAVKHGRSYIGIDLNPEYIEMARVRIFEAGQQISLDI